MYIHACIYIHGYPCMAIEKTWFSVFDLCCVCLHFFVSGFFVPGSDSRFPCSIASYLIHRISSHSIPSYLTLSYPCLSYLILLNLTHLIMTDLYLGAPLKNNLFCLRTKWFLRKKEKSEDNWFPRKKKTQLFV